MPTASAFLPCRPLDRQARVRAPRLPADAGLWLNVAPEEPLPLQPGTVYLLDFWTFGCVNCQHVLPNLARLEVKYADKPFAVVGVHSGKFPYERTPQGVENAVARLGITHPVLRDDDYDVWRSFAVRAWPTFVVVDANGYITLTVSGEGHFEAMDAAIADALGNMNNEAAQNTPARFASTLAFDTPLRFPGNVSTDASGSRLFIADTGHHRIVIAPLTPPGGTTLETSRYIYVGDGNAGFTDGAFATTRFRDPHGMALSDDGETLYIADTGNHAIRSVNLQAGTVETVAGTGRQSQNVVTPGPAGNTDLNSPFDLAMSADGTRLYIALSGAHQIGLLDLSNGELIVSAGSGREGRADGSAQDAAFAQPSGLALSADGVVSFVADAESSSLRAVTTKDGATHTIAGGDLFDWGNTDGDKETARFQHPLGVAVSCEPNNMILFIADTYNHALRRFDPRTSQVTTLPLPPGILNEPGGLSVADNDDTLYIADTGNHRIVRVATQTGDATPLALPGLCAPGLCHPTFGAAEAGL